MPFLAGASYAAGCGRGLMQSGVLFTRDRAFASPRTNVDGSLIGGLPVTGFWGLVGQGQVGLVVVDFLALVGVIVDNGLIETSAYKCLEASQFPR